MTMLRESSTTMLRESSDGESARDVVVVGGGPGGLAAAAARGGAATLLVEAAPTFGQPVRATGGSWPTDLEPFGLDASVWHPVRDCELWSAPHGPFLLAGYGGLRARRPPGLGDAR